MSCRDLPRPSSTYADPAAALSKAAIRNRTLEVESRDFEALLGRPVTPLNEAVDAFVQGLKVAA